MAATVRICQYFGSLSAGQGDLLPHQGGVARAVIDLSAALRDAGQDVVVASRADDTTTRSDSRSDGPGFVALGRSRLPGGVLCASGLEAARALIAGCDVLHLHEVWDPACWQLARVARRNGTPYVISAHGSLDDFSIGQKALKKRAYLTLLGRRMLERAAAVVCTATSEAEQSHKWYPRGNPVVLPLVMDLALFGELPGPEQAIASLPGAAHDRPRLLFLGRLHPKKGIERLIDVAAALRDAGVDCTTVIAGSGQFDYTASLHARAAELGVADSVHFPGFVVGADRVSLYQWADLFVFPTHQENWGIVLFEALAAGTPVLTTRAVGVWEELERTGGATFVDDDLAPLVAAIRRLVADRPRLVRTGETARDAVLTAHSSPAVVSRYIDFYRELRR